MDSLIWLANPHKKRFLWTAIVFERNLLAWQSARANRKGSLVELNSGVLWWFSEIANWHLHKVVHSAFTDSLVAAVQVYS